MPKQSTTTGRPTKLTSELQASLCNLIARGHYATTACAAVGLGEATYFRWLELGTDHLEKRGSKRVRVSAKSPYREFREAIEKSKAQAQMLAMEAIRDAAFDVVTTAEGQRVRAKNWTAAAWYLERTRPDQFARRDVLHQPGSDSPKRPDETPTKKRVVFGGRYKKDGGLQTSAVPGDSAPK